jgi:hypothetical protein
MRVPRFIALSAICLLMIRWLANAKDTEWPASFDTPGGKITIYQPQPESLKGDRLVARAAVSFTQKGTTDPVFGAIWINARLLTDREKRTYTIQEFSVTQAKFPASTPEQESQFTKLVENAANAVVLKGSLDRLLSSLDQAEKEHKSAENLKNDPPKILFSNVPAILVPIDGKPVLRPIENSSISRVINTPCAILYDPSDKKYYLTDGKTWSSAQEIMGPWQSEAKPPKEVVDVAPKDTSTAPEGTKSKSGARIIVATEPTELIVTDGKPEFASVTGTNLLYMSNTESNVIMEIDSQSYYVLISGRWFRSKSMDGPWEYVKADALPVDFVKIPPKSDVGEVRTFVAGTEEAQDAILDASIPQTTAVKRNDESLTVSYDGEPKFEPIQGTSMHYAANSAYSVLLISGRYYCCNEAVWYEAPGPKGPWAVCVKVPDEVYTQPPSSPAYNTKYVYVYEETPTVVYMGYLPGYTGCYVYGPTIVYGTGYPYDPWYGKYYYPRPVTYGVHVSYNPWTGWGFGFGMSTGYMTFGVSFHSYHCPPYYRPPYYGGGRYGPGGYRPVYRPPYAGGPRPPYRPAYPPPGGTGGGTRPSRPPGQAGNVNPDINNNIYDRGGNGKRNASVSALPDNQRPKATRGGDNNVLVDKKGDVYRRDKGGNWEQRQGNNWTRPTTGPDISGGRPGAATGTGAQTRPSTSQTRPAQPQAQPAQPQNRQAPSSLDRDYSARQRGAERSQQYQQQRSAPSRGGGGGGRRR